MNLERERHVSKKKYICKRNKGDHVLVLVKPNRARVKSSDTKVQYLANLMQYRPDRKSFWIHHGYNIYECSKCGHIEWKGVDINGKETT